LRRVNDDEIDIPAYGRPIIFIMQKALQRQKPDVGTSVQGYNRNSAVDMNQHAFSAMDLEYPLNCLVTRNGNCFQSVCSVQANLSHLFWAQTLFRHNGDVPEINHLITIGFRSIACSHLERHCRMSSDNSTFNPGRWSRSTIGSNPQQEVLGS
jgi:hypothetical protein